MLFTPNHPDLKIMLRDVNKKTIIKSWVFFVFFLFSQNQKNIKGKHLLPGSILYVIYSCGGRDFFIPVLNCSLTHKTIHQLTEGF